MLAAGCSDRCPTAVADRDAGPSIAMAGRDPIPNTVATTIAGTASSTAASTTAFSQRRTDRQSSDCESKHEHSESCHVAPPH
jgi:hypothetical protein